MKGNVCGPTVILSLCAAFFSQILLTRLVSPPRFLSDMDQTALIKLSVDFDVSVWTDCNQSGLGLGGMVTNMDQNEA